MSILSDKDIFSLLVEKKLVISPLEVSQIQPASVDLRLGAKLQIPCPETLALYPGAEKPSPRYTDYNLEQEHYTLKPGEVVYASTLEELGIPSSFNAKIYNKNSLALAGLHVCSASYINPGYKGVMPLVLKNIGVYNLVIGAGMQICQLELSALHTPATRSYPERYNEQTLAQLAQNLGMDKPDSSQKSQLSLFLEKRIKELASAKS